MLERSVWVGVVSLAADRRRPDALCLKSSTSWQDCQVHESFNHSHEKYAEGRHMDETCRQLDMDPRVSAQIRVR